MSTKKNSPAAASLNRNAKRDLIRSRAEKLCSRLNAAGVPADVNFEVETTPKAKLDEFGFSEDAPLTETPADLESEGDNE